jgi:hypothetical protein
MTTTSHPLPSPSSSPATGIRVEIVGPGGPVFREQVPDALLTLDHCVLELSGRRPSRFVFFKKARVECFSPAGTHAFDVVDGCLSMSEKRLTLICRRASACRASTPESEPS